jgi:hypothetical protein
MVVLSPRRAIIRLGAVPDVFDPPPGGLVAKASSL